MSMHGQFMLVLSVFFTAALLFDMTQAELQRRNGKSQRSTPSLRLRFGRSVSDMLTPPMTHSITKRWFGDVHQKPIRSPSLRLRFGRATDQRLAAKPSPRPNLLLDNGYFLKTSPEMNVNRYDFVRRMLRHSEPAKFWIDNQVDNQPDDETKKSFILQTEEQQGYDTLLSDLLNAERLRSMLLALRSYDDDVDDETAEFQRETRKPAPLRLRFGRSTSAERSAATSGNANDNNEETKKQLNLKRVDNNA